MRAACLALAALIGLAGPAGAGEPPGAVEMVTRAVREYVVPRYRGFASTTADLEREMAGLCDVPSAGRLGLARRQFGAAAESWASVELVRFGPAAVENRLERILYWPDRRGTGLKQVQEILAAQDPSAVDLARLAGKSVAVQGLGALEFVLHGTGSEALEGPDGAYRCAYGRTVAENLRRMAGEIARAWEAPGGIAAQWTAPGPDNPLYRDGGEALGELVDILVHGLEMVRDARIGGFLGATPQEDRPRQALFWRSGLTAETLRRNVEALAGIAGAAGFAAYLPEDRRWIAGSLRFEFENARRALLSLSGRPVGEILADAEARGRLAYVVLVTSGLSELTGRQLAGAFGVTAGFSSLDGD